MNHELAAHPDLQNAIDLIKRFDDMISEMRNLLESGAARVAESIAASTDIAEIHALLTEYVAPAAALIEQFERNHLRRQSIPR